MKVCFKTYKVIFTLFIILFSSCSKKVIQIAPDYYNKKINTDELYVQFLPTDSFHKEKIDSTFIESNFENNDNFKLLIENNLLLFVEKYSNLNGIILNRQIVDLKQQEYLIDGQTIQLKVPSSTHINESFKNDFGYFLFLEDISIKLEKEREFFIIPIKNYPFIFNENEELLLSYKFIFWDNKYSKAVSYGKIDLSIEVTQNEIKKGVLELLEESVRKMFKNTPFN